MEDPLPFSLESLPLELLDAIVRKVEDPSSLQNLSTTSRTMRNRMLQLHNLRPTLRLRDRITPWSSYKRTGKRRVQGPGFLALPPDDRLSRLSTRVRGSFPVSIPEKEEIPRDLLSCARARLLLYPTAPLLIQTSEERLVRYTPDPQASLIPTGELSLCLSREEWGRKAQIRALLESVQVTSATFEIRDYSQYDDYDSRNEVTTVFSRTIQDLHDLLPCLQRVRITQDFLYPLPPSVRVLEIEEASYWDACECLDSEKHQDLQEIIYHTSDSLKWLSNTVSCLWENTGEKNLQVIRLRILQEPLDSPLDSQSLQLELQEHYPQLQIRVEIVEKG